MSILTPHGAITTPSFMPDATYGTVKGLSFNDLKAVGVNEFVTTTLHLENKLDSKYISEYGGLHKFLNWDRPILTDSGGFQVFSLIYRRPNKQNRISDAGCSFVDPNSGEYSLLTPEISQMIQHNLGSDIRVVLDEPVLHEGSYAQAEAAVKRTTEWAKRSKQKFLELLQIDENEFSRTSVGSGSGLGSGKEFSKPQPNPRPLLTAVIQGGNFFELRKRSAEELQEIGFDIYGFGGLPLHNSKRWNLEHPTGFHHELLDLVSGLVVDKPKYGLGIGTPDDIIYCSNLGWDLFDTVLPTRNARHGYLFVSPGQGDVQQKNFDVMHIKTERYKFDESPVDAECDCECCRTISRAYLRHLLRLEDGAGFRLASIHNLRFYSRTMESLQKLTQ